MKHFRFLFQLLILAMLFGCSRQSETSKSRVTTGYHKTRSPQGIPEKRYVLVKNDTIWSYPINKAGNEIIDSVRAAVIAFPKETNKSPAGEYVFNKKTWDF